MSETSAARSVLAPYCVGMGLDMGFGGSAISPTAITFDMPRMYCPSLEGHRQHLQGDATNLPFICSGAFDYIYSSHLIEDFYYDELIGIITEWRRILAPGGVLVLNCPDQKRFLDHCERTGQSRNENHKEIDFSFSHFVDRVLVVTGHWDIVFQDAAVPPYSWVRSVPQAVRRTAMGLSVMLCVPEHQTDRARRLANYCWELDRTDVWMIVMSEEEQELFNPEFPQNRFHSLQAQGIHRAAIEAGGAFIWLEADAIPLKPDWALILSEEYERCRKKFLLSSDSNPPFDLVGGIGCYPKETEWLVPQHFPKSSWDAWLLEAVPHLVARTALIQHSYCVYGPDGFCKEEHRFPRDNQMLREEAILFHRDPFQDLIKRYTVAS